MLSHMVFWDRTGFVPGGRSTSGSRLGQKQSEGGGKRPGLEHIQAVQRRCTSHRDLLPAPKNSRERDPEPRTTLNDKADSQRSPDGPQKKSWLFRLPAPWPWASHVTSLSLDFPTCKVTLAAAVKNKSV